MSEEFISQREHIKLFPEFYNVSEHYTDKRTPAIEVEGVDEVTGLSIVKKPTMEEKYGLSGLKDNSFVQSLREQFSRKGYLSPKQVNCLR